MAFGLAVSGCTNAPDVSVGDKSQVKTGNFYRTGIASFYGRGEALNSHTSNGERFNPNAATAAHRTLPFGTVLHVTNLRNKRTCTVRINDRGPAASTGREIDLSYGAAKACDFVGQGTTKVSLNIVK